MHLASSEGHAAVVKLLIDHCTDAEHVHQLGCVADRWGQTPMLDALRGGHASVCSTFVSARNKPLGNDP